MNDSNKFNWKLFLRVWSTATFGLIAALPYSLAIKGTDLSQLQLPLPLWLVITIQIGSQVLLFGLLIGFGLLLSKKIGLGLPFIEIRLLSTRPQHKFRPVLLRAIIIGTVAALIIIGLDAGVFRLEFHLEKLGIPVSESLEPARWKGFLAAFYGGINEEVLLRLFFLSLIAWLLNLLRKEKTLLPNKIILWSANIIAATVFGLGHLPATAAAGIPLDALVITRAVILNGIGGAAFGWLFFTYGLESAIIAHFTADIILHVIF